MEGVEGGGEGSVQVSQEENRGAAKEEKAKLGQTGSWRGGDDFFIIGHPGLLIFYKYDNTDAVEMGLMLGANRI